MFQEFPKCLYQRGDVAAAFCVVLDAAEEADARAEGFANAGESQAKAKPGRKPKAD